MEGVLYRIIKVRLGLRFLEKPKRHDFEAFQEVI